jgi:hypothetical protein
MDIDSELIKGIIYYIKRIPAWENDDIIIVSVEPRVKGLYVIYRPVRRQQGFGKLISYKELAEW